eukprot:s7885_g1.t1
MCRLGSACSSSSLPAGGNPCSCAASQGFGVTPPAVWTSFPVPCSCRASSFRHCRCDSCCATQSLLKELLEHEILSWYCPLWDSNPSFLQQSEPQTGRIFFPRSSSSGWPSPETKRLAAVHGRVLELEVPTTETWVPSTSEKRKPVGRPARLGHRTGPAIKSSE